ncbi:hypothetical protein BT63DRAFT_425657 [Microthyrium microscopicum]|uniref:DNA helicase n=1 Tax=Microthyrium microscopicum TaxID=703497 RepID=A0A6A6U9Q3_9PEZI|nr:hypothetical protein BT63DRAFT_425657 [Microthyrium microscopicum]
MPKPSAALANHSDVHYSSTNNHNEHDIDNSATSSHPVDSVKPSHTNGSNGHRSDENAHVEMATNGASLKRKFDHFSSPDRDPSPPSKKLAAHTPSPSADKSVFNSAKKQKPPSPPWRAIAADGPSAVIVDGRRKSSRAAVNPAVTPTVKVEESPTRNLERPKSPPWKSALIPGPTSITVGGRRKSTRFIQEESPPPPKKGPGRPRKSLADEPIKIKLNGLNGHGSASTASKGRVGRPKSSRHHDAPAPSETKSTRRGRRASGDAPLESEEYKTTSRSTKTRRGRASVSTYEEPTKYAKQHLRTREAPTFRQHPKHLVPPKTFESFEEWASKDDPLEGEAYPSNTDQVLNEAKTRLRITEAAEEGGVLSDGRCTRFAFKAFPEPVTKYAHWAFVAQHAVYFSTLRSREVHRHMQEASKVAKHVQTAIATEDRWAFLREAKSLDQVYQEEFDYQIKRYKQIVKDVKDKWLMVRQEVDTIKLANWERDQEALGNRHLDEMLEQSTKILDNQFRESSAEATSEMMSSRRHSVAFNSEVEFEDEESDAAGGATEDDENLSESSDEEEDSQEQADDDQELTQEQLMAKYAHVLDSKLPDSSSADEECNANNSDAEDEDKADYSKSDLKSPHSSVESEVDDDFSAYKNLKVDEVPDQLLENSEDESTDMTDDDSGSGGSDSQESEDEEEEEDEGISNTLGFLYGKDEIQTIAKEAREAKRSQSIQTTGEDLEDEAEVDAESELDSDVEMIEQNLPTSDKASDMDHSVASTPRPDQEAAISTPTTSIIPGTPRSFRTEVSPLLRGSLREYQHDGVDWLAKLYSGGRNGILADEMGLGKTIQTIALLAHLATFHEVWGPHLVVVPTSVMLNWEMEFKKWCPAFKILTYYGDVNERRRLRVGWKDDDKWNVIITSYNLVLQDQQAFKRRDWHYLVLDEAHNIKNFQSQRWQTLLTFKTQSRLLLTGTPLQNNLQELWSLLYFLMPAGVDGGGFADLEKFLNTMKRPADQILDQGRQELDPEAQARVSKLHEILRPYLLRRLKSEVEKQMPSKYEHVVYCRLSKRQRQLYDGFMGRADTKRTLSSGNYMSVMNCLMSLRKVCNHPDLFETRQIVTSLAMPKSVAASYEIKDFMVRRRLLSSRSLDLDFCGLLPAAHEQTRKRHLMRLAQIQATQKFERLAASETERLKDLEKQQSDGSDSVSVRVAIEAQKNIIQDLRNRASHMRRVLAAKPIYGADLIDMVTMPNRFDPRRPNKKDPEFTNAYPYLDKCITISRLMPTLGQVSSQATELITKFACITPTVVAEDVGPLTLTPAGVETVQLAESFRRRIDPFHEARVRLSIAFPDKRLLQYDCGKLQALDKLLRQLQAGGHRALIFTQFTKVLDILEQFLNIHGHRYLRLDGATKVEQRQILTDRFNNDTRILTFILSTRSGGLGINLTGADTVIFYDLDWNPAMDKQCQDRVHRIGQTRDVHIYRFVSEYTIEANILRKSNQKRLLDDVIIQRGEFTTDMFQRVTYRDALEGMINDERATNQDAEASAVFDKFLNNVTEMSNVLDKVEDKEDTAAAKVAQQEIVLGDDVDFDENIKADQQEAMAANPNAAVDKAVEETGSDDPVKNGEIPHVDDYMVRLMTELMVGEPIKLPKSAGAKKKKGGYDYKRRR